MGGRDSRGVHFVETATGTRVDMAKNSVSDLRAGPALIQMPARQATPRCRVAASAAPNGHARATQVLTVSYYGRVNTD